MILARFDPRVSRLVRVIGLLLVSWSILATHHHPGTSGRDLVVLILFVACALASLVWVVQSDLEAALGPETYLLAAAGGGLIGGSPDSAASVFVFVAVVSAALRADLDRAWTVGALGTLTLAVSVLVWDEDALGLLAYTLGFAAATLAASNARRSRLQAEQAELLLAQVQRSQEERLRAARLEESTRIAREIHDVLAHSLAGLTIQLEATCARLQNGAATAEILTRVEHAHALARDGLRETRRAVGALRGDEPRVSDAIEALVAAHRTLTEAPAELSIVGASTRLRDEAGQAVLRIVQEALTNIAKHARGAAVSITVDVGPEVITTVVEDEGRPVMAPVVSVLAAGDTLAASGGGFGLAGMRERARALGGTLDAGPRGPGWRVELRVPAGGAPEATAL